MKTNSTAVEMTVRGTEAHEGSPSTGPGILAQLWDKGWVRRAGLLILLCALWEWYAARLANPLMVPAFSATLQALVDAVGSGGLPARIVTSFKILLIGYGIGVLLALILAMAATMTRLGSDLLELCTSMFNPLSIGRAHV